MFLFCFLCFPIYRIAMDLCRTQTIFFGSFDRMLLVQGTRLVFTSTSQRNHRNGKTIRVTWGNVIFRVPFPECSINCFRYRKGFVIHNTRRLLHVIRFNTIRTRRVRYIQFNETVRSGVVRNISNLGVV